MLTNKHYYPTSFARRRLRCNCSRYQSHSEVVRSLQTKIKDSEKDLIQSSLLEQDIRKLVSSLQACPYPCQAYDEKLSSTWRLLWTTEKETLFILANAKFFGTSAGNVYQIIDVNAKRLQNVITFPPEGSFVVNSDLNSDGHSRCSFKFTAAALNLPNQRKIPFPPFGQGWFETLYLDEEMRVSVDIRGDILVTERDGPPMFF
ncbi:hypothetical protein CEUSTIGMA_g5451.t1 [Chlamydomonas eustigma]|uniref:Plastid lipid-associated protein/fibrillin conserved domain-containing protein n=1 Tax=Chlamydomonas eustigma TaxID=1157962 RepID=A0A250X515_9CHLO|nr:hypothetical protein CEUSTIGMA_g5451.t1 [Chlamydomonas eustigma]|eukprot:GAX78009.1 hypothetical protein CEUSTIGMA_g5451.t1 [Chlamydomonas eustigma]